ncbi:uncharacterized protein LOC114359430 [Ostrinia furnacalis]|uniref:uncharacterized protein LOC114359430 n=1 Tax=Ostrinia furnacalis TaxID=93504 RepID=UPI00103F62A5|nr:uncharacterized protein LOC114359430 [Ostrinia furnacalis]
MFSKIVALSAILAVSAAGLLPEPHYSSAAAVSSQSIVRHDQPQTYATKLVAAPVAKVAVAAPVYHAAPAVAYHAAPAHYSSADAVSSQSIVRHDQQPSAKLVAAAPVYHAPAQIIIWLAYAHSTTCPHHGRTPNAPTAD